jgi:hypothetical protein
VRPLRVNDPRRRGPGARLAVQGLREGRHAARGHDGIIVEEEHRPRPAPHRLRRPAIDGRRPTLVARIAEHQGSLRGGAARGVVRGAIVDDDDRIYLRLHRVNTSHDARRCLPRRHDGYDGADGSGDSGDSASSGGSASSAAGHGILVASAKLRRGFKRDAQRRVDAGGTIGAALLRRGPAAAAAAFVAACVRSEIGTAGVEPRFACRSMLGKVRWKCRHFLDPPLDFATQKHRSTVEQAAHRQCQEQPKPRVGPCRCSPVGAPSEACAGERATGDSPRDER